MHEHTPREVEPIARSSDRAFGLVFAAVFALIAVMPAWHAGAIRLWALAVAAVFLVLALLRPGVLAPLNRIWAAIGLLLHKVVSPVALAVMFFGVLTPTGLLMRLFGKDPLRLRRDRAAASYWIERAPPGPTAESLRNQF
jgi:hypothetical protein